MGEFNEKCCCLRQVLRGKYPQFAQQTNTGMYMQQVCVLVTCMLKERLGINVFAQLFIVKSGCRMLKNVGHSYCTLCLNVYRQQMTVGKQIAFCVHNGNNKPLQLQSSLGVEHASGITYKLSKDSKIGVLTWQNHI